LAPTSVALANLAALYLTTVFIFTCWTTANACGKKLCAIAARYQIWIKLFMAQAPAKLNYIFSYRIILVLWIIMP